MSLRRIVVDNSAMQPAFFPEPRSDHFDAGLVTNRARSLVNAVRLSRVRAYVPPSFFREFLNVALARLDARGGRTADDVDYVRAQWDDLLTLGLITVPLEEIVHHSGILALDEQCPPADAWYVAAAVHARADFWMSHEHSDGLVAAASRHVKVRLLSKEAVDY